MNISFSKLGSHGGVGNCLFQIAGVLGLAEKYGAQAAFPQWRGEKYFTDPLPHGEMQTSVIKEKHFHYHDWELSGDSDLLGYFQSAKYFPIGYKPRFTEEFLQPLKNHEAFKKQTIGVHIRRGDYVGHKLYYQLPVHWFISALVSIEGWQEKNIVIVSDDPAYAKIHFECLPNVYFMEGNDIEDLAAFSLCDTQILSNSSFSWWGCYLSENQNGIHSGELFRGEYAGKDIGDFYLPSWTLHPVRKLDLLDCTFTIPVFYDSRDRKQNLDLSVCMLQSSFETNIIVGEQGGNKFEYMNQWCDYRNFFSMKNFHRTKMLNDMAMLAETPYIANWDADVIIAPAQIYLTVLRLRNGEDMVFPYDGRFARLPRELWFKPIEKLMDIGAIGDTEPKGKRGKPVPESSVGGAVFFNKESFIDGGMENEYMISFGPEDCERNDRFKKLGFKVAEQADRVKGPLYHIDHWCGPDSNKLNPFFAANHAELAKIRAMTAEGLRTYVDSWPWRHKYTGAYYRRISEGAVRSAREVYKALVNMGVYRYKDSVFDVGMGVGEWNNENGNYKGLDFNIPERSLLIPVKNYINCNLEKEVIDLFKINQINSYHNFALCLCLEVAEHISEGRADTLIEMLCNLSDRVLFSAAIPMQGGTGHINEQPAHYWAAKFEANGFYPYKTDIRRALFHNPNVEMWYKNNMILYTREKFEIDYELDFVHPDMFVSCVTNLKNQLEANAVNV